MKSMTFDEFFLVPPGTIFGQATGLPHQFSTGLYRKGNSFPDDEFHDGPMVEVVDLVGDTPDQVVGIDRIFGGQLGTDHRFLVYEPHDLDRLAGLIVRGPGWVAHEGGEGR